MAAKFEEVWRKRVYTSPKRLKVNSRNLQIALERLRNNLQPYFKNPLIIKNYYSLRPAVRGGSIRGYQIVEKTGWLGSRWIFSAHIPTPTQLFVYVVTDINTGIFKILEPRARNAVRKILKKHEAIFKKMDSSFFVD